MTKSEVTKLFNEHRSSGRIEFVTFHPAYSYEEFIEGLTVRTGTGSESTDTLKYILKPGLFKNFCTRALLAALGESWSAGSEDLNWDEAFQKYQSKKNEIDWENAPKFVLVIDEINRGDISKILGELITLLEVDKRLGAINELVAKLPNSREDFGVPQNVFIIGTMNTADRSIALLDIALRRRFGFFEVTPDLDLVLDPIRNEGLESLDAQTKKLLEKSVAALKEINASIAADRSLGKDKGIGHSFLLGIRNQEDLQSVWRHDILPLIDEYCFGSDSKKSNLLFKKESHNFDIENIPASLDAVINAKQ